MTTLSEWLCQLLNDGIADLAAPVGRSAADDRHATALLAESFSLAAADLAGPPIAFDPGVALLAAAYLGDACWQLVGPAAPEVAPLTTEPTTAAMHLSADLTLRYLPDVHRRACLRDTECSLAQATAAVLRRWPLSGALADVSSAPTTSLDFAGHRGLQLLFAERLVQRPRPAWVPKEGAARQWIEYVFHERHRPMPPPAKEHDEID